jgi:hypothetical protein
LVSGTYCRKTCSHGLRQLLSDLVKLGLGVRHLFGQRCDTRSSSTLTLLDLSLGGLNLIEPLLDMTTSKLHRGANSTKAVPAFIKTPDHQLLTPASQDTHRAAPPAPSEPVTRSHRYVPSTRATTRPRYFTQVQARPTAAQQALQLWGEDPAIALSDLVEEIATEIRLLRLAETERAHHQAARDAALADVDPAGLATSLPGLGPVGATQLLAAMGRPGRFRNAAAFKSFTGLAPKASETGNTDRKSQPMSKAGNSALRTQLIQSANTARQLDPQLAAIYYTQMTERGAPHLKALCVVAARLAERAWLTLAKAEPYVIRDLQGRPISPQQARELIAEQFTVPADVRRRRRSTKPAGRAPQQCSRHAKSRHTAGHEAALPTPTITEPNPAVNPTQHTALTPTPA